MLPFVLVVDDEPTNLSLFERILEDKYRVFCVQSGSDALDVLQQVTFDLVLLDIMMPDIDGIKVLQHIRSNPKTADLPVILVSALHDAQNISNGLDLGANDYITKPVDIDVMQARVQTQIRLKQREDKHKNIISQLENAHETKNRFMRIASHDLKGPITNVRMVAYLLSKAQETYPLSEALEYSVESMQTVIADFIDTATRRTEDLVLNFGPIALSDIVDDLLRQYNVHAANKGITLHVEPISGLICADDARFRQALGNLISNAIKYTHPNTTVRIWAEQQQHTIRICVADQGPGIPAEEQSRLFTQYGQLSTRPTAGEDSTGLGLWIVKHFITLQQGQVGMNNHADGGAVFWIEMPAA